MQAEAQSGGVKKMERECVRAIKALPIRLREAFLAQKYQLLFVEGQGSPYDGVYATEEPVYRRGKVIRHERISFPRASSAARFVGSDGQVYHFYSVHGNAPHAHKDWKQAGRTFHHIGAQVIYPHFKKELHELEIKRAEYFLKQMPPTHRQAFIAAMHELCYMPDGGRAYTKVYDEDFCGEKLPTYAMVQGCAFIGADGSPIAYHRIMQEMERGKGFYHWKCLRLAWHHGCKKILLPYEAEVAAMLKHHGALGGGAGPKVEAVSNVTPPAAPPAPETKAPAASPLGSTVPPVESSVASPLGSPIKPGSSGPAPVK